MKPSLPFGHPHCFFIRISSSVILLAGTLIPVPTQAGTSANYSLTPDSIDSGGLRGTSTDYTLHPAVMPGGYGTSAAYTLRSGFIGQLADAIATAIDITASPLAVNETGTRQLNATLILDDLSSQPLAASSVTWIIQSGPISNISADGIVTAATVYQNSAATVHGIYQTLTGTLGLTILNTLQDNFGTYAADGIDDDWQVLYFGQPPNANAGPLIDPDSDGQNNFFEFTAGVHPTQSGSIFRIGRAEVPGQATQERIIFSPRFADRNYVVKTSATLGASSWTDLTGSSFTDQGATRTVTDLNATGERKFYRVEITRP